MQLLWRSRRKPNSSGRRSFKQVSRIQSGWLAAAIAGRSSFSIQEICSRLQLGWHTQRYFNDNGWNSTVYPWSQVHFTYRCMFPKWSDWTYNYTPKGLWKQRTTRVMRLLLTVATIYSIVRARRSGKGFGYFTDSLRSGLERIAGFVTSAKNRIWVFQKTLTVWSYIGHIHYRLHIWK